MGCKKAPSTGGCSDVTGIDPEYETKAVGEETPDWSCCRCCWAGETRSGSVHNRKRKWWGEKGEKGKTGHNNGFANWHPSVQGSIGLTHSISLTHESAHISLPLSLFLFFSPPFPRNGAGYWFLSLSRSYSLSLSLSLCLPLHTQNHLLAAAGWVNYSALLLVNS